MLQALKRIANRLDKKGLFKEAQLADKLLFRLADIEEEEQVALSVSDRVRAAFEANPDNVEKVLATRNPDSPSALGSVFTDSQTIESLTNANWELYNHPDVQAPAVAFKANIPGSVGVVEISKLNPSQELILSDGHETGYLAPSVRGISREVESQHTTLLLGPIDDQGTEGVWTMFPGDPIMPSELKVEDVPTNQRKITVSDALKLGFEYAKVE